MPKKVFISYRRDDAAGFCHAIYDRLVDYLPKNRVFMDVLGLEPGANFVERLEAAVSQCDVLLALIGRRWAGEDGAGNARIRDPHDWVRVEIATALRRRIKVIPVLLDGAPMPEFESLPDDLRPLVQMNATDVRSTRLDADVRNLTEHTLRALGETWSPDEEPGGKIYAVLASLYAIFTGAMVLFVSLASMFMERIGTPTILGTITFVLNTMILLRLPIHARIRTLTRQRAFQIGSVVHLVGFFILSVGATDVDGVGVFAFGIVPSASLYLASYAMRRLVRA